MESTILNQLSSQLSATTAKPSPTATCTRTTPSPGPAGRRRSQRGRRRRRESDYAHLGHLHLVAGIILAAAADRSGHIIDLFCTFTWINHFIVNCARANSLSCLYLLAQQFLYEIFFTNKCLKSLDTIKINLTVRLWMVLLVTWPLSMLLFLWCWRNDRVHAQVSLCDVWREPIRILYRGAFRGCRLLNAMQIK